MKSYYYTFIATILTIFTVFVMNVVSAELKVPPLQQRVTDLTQTLSHSERQQLESKLVQFENDNANGSQIAVLIIPTLSGESIEGYATRVFDKWQLGNKEYDNGVLLLIALNDRELRIEVGYGLEGTLTDLTANQIIRQTLMPNFRTGNYFTGINQALNAIESVIAGESFTTTVTTSDSSASTIGQSFDQFFGYIIIISIIWFVIVVLIQAFKPQRFMQWLKIYLLATLAFIILMSAYQLYSLENTMSEIIEISAFYTLFFVLFSVMWLFGFMMLQIIIAIPIISFFETFLAKKQAASLNTTTDQPKLGMPKSGKTKLSKPKQSFKIYEKKLILTTLAVIALFAILPSLLQFLVIVILFVAFFIFASQNGGGGGSSGSGSSFGGSSSGGGFSGGGGRSGGGGSSGRW